MPSRYGVSANRIHCAGTCTTTAAPITAPITPGIASIQNSGQRTLPASQWLRPDAPHVKASA